MSCVSKETPAATVQHKNNLHIRQLPARVNTSAVFAAVCCAFLSACSVSNSLGSAESTDTVVTSSVAKPIKQEGIGSTDAEIIKSVVADSESTNTLAWQNPDTGNKGTITAIDKFVGSHGQQCKKFQTTVDTFMGISLYNGETCELRKGFWVLSWFLRQES